MHSIRVRVFSVCLAVTILIVEFIIEYTQKIQETFARFRYRHDVSRGATVINKLCWSASNRSGPHQLHIDVHIDITFYQFLARKGGFNERVLIVSPPHEYA